MVSSVRAKFDRELAALNNDLVNMASMIEDAINISIKAMQTGDVELAKNVIHADRDINDLEKEIEARCLKLILRQQPVARDLRFISTAMKMITDLERIGDHAADIAVIAIEEGKKVDKNLREDVVKMSEISLEMVASSIAAFIHENLKNAEACIKRDDDVDELFEIVKNDIISLLKEDKIEPDRAINTLMLAKYFERIADHATNIAEWVVFFITGEHKDTRII